MVFIYILQLKNNKYYIGKTTNPLFRLDTHFNKSGSSWTKKHKPIKVLELIENCDDYDEDKYTLKYMEKYGINNVRGGSFCEIKLTDDNRKTITKMISGSTDKCYICGEKGHFASTCEYDDEDYEVEQFIQMLEEENRCFRCHRKGHYEKDCYAETYLDGMSITDSDDEYSCDDEYSGGYQHDRK